MTKIISHELSKFGKIDIALHHKSLDFYEILQSKGLITYLKRLDHLGFISKSNPGNNHKRWDYIMLQLYIISKLRDPVFRIGLSSNHDVDDQNELSGIVILQIAVLFSNIGHLEGTLASEIGLIHYLKDNEECRKLFLDKINQSDDWKAFANKILLEEDYYKVKYLIGLNFLLKNVKDKLLLKTVLLFFKNSLTDDEPKLRKLKWIFLKVRQISFIYLDSFNSHFPFQIDITKILLNVFNYKTLFNPSSSEYDSFFDSCETTLTKELYISSDACIALQNNTQLFTQYLENEISRQGQNKLLLDNFLTSLISRNVPQFKIAQSKNVKCFQYYISKEDIELFGIRRELFNYKEARLSNYADRSDLNSLLNLKMGNNLNKVCLVHDGRKTMDFNNLIIDISSITSENQNQFLLNYFNLHSRFLEKYKYVSNLTSFENIAGPFFYKHYSRKIFLQLFRIMFKNKHNLSAYIKFENNQLITELFKVYPAFQITGYVKSKKTLLKTINNLIDIDRIPKDVKNNHRIAKHIIEKVTEIKKNVKVFYCVLPVGINRYDLNPKKLLEQKNPEAAKEITDIDMVMVLFNKSKFEFYLIEGKNLASGYAKAVREDFESKIKPNLLHPEMMPIVKTINKNGAKGGYICYKN